MVENWQADEIRMLLRYDLEADVALFADLLLRGGVVKYDGHVRRTALKEASGCSLNALVLANH